MNAVNRFFLLLVLCMILPLSVSAHSGRTDANGGHRSDSGYHYHHGYPAHQHTNGQCPYNLDDRTGMDSGSSSNESASSKTDAPSKDSASGDVLTLFPYSFLVSPFILIISSVIFHRKSFSSGLFFWSSIFACPIAVFFVARAVCPDLLELLIVTTVPLLYYLLFRLWIFIFFRD